MTLQLSRISNSMSHPPIVVGGFRIFGNGSDYFLPTTGHRHGKTAWQSQEDEITHIFFGINTIARTMSIYHPIDKSLIRTRQQEHGR